MEPVPGGTVGGDPLEEWGSLTPSRQRATGRRAGPTGVKRMARGDTHVPELGRPGAVRERTRNARL